MQLPILSRLPLVVFLFSLSDNCWAEHTNAPESVALVGSLQDELGCSDDWQPECEVTELSSSDGRIWSARFNLPAGDYEYKITFEDTWEENYGVHGQNGGNIPLSLAASTIVTFTYDHQTHAISGNAPGVESGVDAESLIVKNPHFRDELLNRIQQDQEARSRAIAWDQEHGKDGWVDEDLLSESDKKARAELWKRVEEIDTKNTVWLKGVVDRQGWPTYSEVGIEAGDAAWLLVQHADLNPAFQRRCLDMMAKLPKDEMSRQNLAYLTDRVLLAEGKKQIYGTQFSVRDGELTPRELEDEPNIDKRRAEMGLPPLSEYLEMAARFYRGELD